MLHSTDLDLGQTDIAALTSSEAIAALLSRLGYDTGRRAVLTPESIGLAGESAAAVKKIELLAEDDEGFLRVVFVQLRSLTAKSRNDLARVLGKANVDHLLILASDFDVLEFVLLAKRKREHRGPGGNHRIQTVPITLAVDRRAPSRPQMRILRGLTWTCRDALDQFDKLRTTFEAAVFTEQYFQNRALFADYYLTERLKEDDPAWQENPSAVFAAVKDLLRDAQHRFAEKGEQVVRDKLYEPIFKLLGFKVDALKTAKDDQTKPDYTLTSGKGKKLTAAFVYQWDRWLDGPDIHDSQTPEENPGACVVSALEEGAADWIIVTNGRRWRLYSRQAHSRATNFYEVDLVEALVASGDTDPNEAFRYWWLFFRPAAFQPVDADEKARCWLDSVVEGSRDYAKRLGERLKDRIFVTIFPHLAQGFLADRRKRLGVTARPTEEELSEGFEATLTLLYRLLFLLYAESRDLLPIREAPYKAASLKKLKEEIAERAGVAESEVPARLAKAYSEKETALYDRLSRLFKAMDEGDPTLNVPTYNGGLFITSPAESDRREHRIARFLTQHKVPDRYLALALDRLARDQDEKTLGLVFIDYKSLEVRHLGSIYEGLLEFKLKVAAEDLATKTEKKKEKYIPLAQARPGRGRSVEAVVRKGEVYLSNDKAERKATGSYYTPDPIVEYIVEHTVGPVLHEKLEALQPAFRGVRKSYERHLQNATAHPVILPGGEKMDERQYAAEQTYADHKDLVDRLFAVTVLDPAMGSGHFLVEAVDFLTDRLVTFLNQFPVNPVTFALERTRRSIREALGEQGVTVDPDKLTDVNLLKRHVLKRCIYGVDLNPMAVELAKVSLWLDCFTLGAPLSFLDHHLRCGNSLVGATFADLERETREHLFRIDYEPLRRAIQHVLLINETADATAAEAKRSASEYDQARDRLAGYRIVLDLLVAKHFGFAEAPRLLTHAQELELETRDQLLASLADDDERALVERVEALSDRPDLRFFHWEIEFPEIFFAFADANRRHLRHKDEMAESEGAAGFDVVVGNPPYDVLAEKELQTDLSELLGYFRSETVYAPARGGKQNLYKLFICRSVRVAARGGTVGHIVPMPLLGDEQAAGVRKMLLSDTSLLAVEAFPQKDDPRKRVFPDAKLSTCVFATTKLSEDRKFRCRVHPGKDILPDSPSLVIRRDDVKLYDPENQPIVACSQADWDLAVKIMASGRMKRLGDFCKAYQGEVNETTDGKKGNISHDPNDGPQVLRGSTICLYALRPPSQGEAMYLRRETYLKDKKPSAKAWHHEQERVGFQRNSPQNNFRRLIACRVPSGQFCCDTVSYFPEEESSLPPSMLLALFNSKLLDWFFRLGSTNSKVNDYQVKVLPAPLLATGDPPDDQGLIEVFRTAVAAEQWSDALAAIEPALQQPPYRGSVVSCIQDLVQRITEIESSRGDIRRAERSSLAPKAQPLQDLLDRILYRIAGLTDAEARGLEDRLQQML